MTDLSAPNAGARRSGGLLLAIDTATSHAVVGVGEADGTPIDVRAWEVGHGHSAELLPALESILRDNATPLESIGATVVGLGPGSFTGLRVGLATGKVLAYALGRPIVGVETSLALALADQRGRGTADSTGRRPQSDVAVLLPAGPNGAYCSLVSNAADMHGSGAAARVVTRGDVREAVGNAEVIAVDLPDDVAGQEATARGRAAVQRLGVALLDVGARRVRAGDVDDVVTLVPAYVTLPRGVREAVAEMQWSPALR